MGDFKEVSERISVLEQFPFEDTQPNIEGPNLSIFYDGYIDYNYSDKDAFNTRWTEETQYISQLVF